MHKAVGSGPVNGGKWKEDAGWTAVTTADSTWPIGGCHLCRRLAFNGPPTDRLLVRKVGGNAMWDPREHTPSPAAMSGDREGRFRSASLGCPAVEAASSSPFHTIQGTTTTAGGSCTSYTRIHPWQCCHCLIPPPILSSCLKLEVTTAFLARLLWCTSLLQREGSVAWAVSALLAVGRFRHPTTSCGTDLPTETDAVAAHSACSKGAAPGGGGWKALLLLTRRPAAVLKKL